MITSVPDISTINGKSHPESSPRILDLHDWSMDTWIKVSFSEYVRRNIPVRSLLFGFHHHFPSLSSLCLHAAVPGRVRDLGSIVLTNNMTHSLALTFIFGWTRAYLAMWTLAGRHGFHHMRTPPLCVLISLVFVLDKLQSRYPPSCTGFEFRKCSVSKLLNFGHAHPSYLYMPYPNSTPFNTENLKVLSPTHNFPQASPIYHFY